MGKYRSAVGKGLKIVKTEALEIKDDFYYVEDELFSGVAVEMDDNGVGISSTRYIDGKDSGRYISEFFPESKDFKVLDAEFLDYYTPYERSYYLEPPALVYFFEGWTSECEELYDDGKFLKSEFCSHYYSGNLKSMRLGEGPVYETYKWDEDGNPTSIYIIEKDPVVCDRFYIDINYSDDLKLKSLTLYGDCFERLKELQPELMFDVPDDISYFKEVKGDSYLRISGDAVDDEVISNLLKKEGLKDVERLILSRTMISEEILSDIVKLKKLEELIISGSKFSTYTIERLKKESTNLKINYEEDD